MKKFILALISDGSAVSSARTLNILGAIILGGVYIADFIAHRSMNIDATAILAMYFGGVYGVSKGLTVIKDKFGNEVEKRVDNA